MTRRSARAFAGVAATGEVGYRQWAIDLNRFYRGEPYVTGQRRLRRVALLILAVLLFLAGRAFAQVTSDAPIPGRPKAVVDLATKEGADSVRAVWRYADVKVSEVPHHGPGPDLKASGAPNKTYDYSPHSGAADFDDSKWETLDPATLDHRRANGKFCFNWYRTKVTLPDRVGNFDVAGSTIVFEIVVDDYAEVWVNGQLPRVLGQTGGQLIKGFNAPNRVVLTQNAKPGEQFQLAIFGINGPISYTPETFIWVKSATLDFYETQKPRSAGGEIVRKDAALDEIVAKDAIIEKLASGFTFTEGPVWMRDGGYLLFSDPNENRIYRLGADNQVTVYRTKSGYAGVDISEYGQPGSNGLTLDKEGRLTVNEHGRRRVVRLEKNGAVTVLAEKFEGKRLNSPNDLVYRSDGALYFTDPPFGLPKFSDDPRKELPFSGVFCLKDGKLTVVSKDLNGPNGLAFSPDEKFFYVDNWNENKKVVMRYDARSDGSLTNGKIFFDMTSAGTEDALDGLKVDKRGDVYVSGPGGIWILSPQGKHLGTIVGPEHPHNFTFGDADGKTLYMCAKTSIYRIRLNVEGIRP